MASMGVATVGCLYVTNYVGGWQEGRFASGLLSPLEGNQHTLTAFLCLVCLLAFEGIAAALVNGAWVSDAL
jgi:hypothetical protein